MLHAYGTSKNSRVKGDTIYVGYSRDILICIIIYVANIFIYEQCTSPHCPLGVAADECDHSLYFVVSFVDFSILLSNLHSPVDFSVDLLVICVYQSASSPIDICNLKKTVYSKFVKQTKNRKKVIINFKILIRRRFVCQCQFACTYNSPVIRLLIRLSMVCKFTCYLSAIIRLSNCMSFVKCFVECILYLSIMK